MSERYNGWTNYETWCVNLHLTDDEGSQTYWREAAQQAWDNPDPSEVWSHSEAARYTLADRLKDAIEDGVPAITEDGLPALYHDLLTAAISEVDWSEIADGLLDGIDEYEQQVDTAQA